MNNSSVKNMSIDNRFKFKIWSMSDQKWIKSKSSDLVVVNRDGNLVSSFGDDIVICQWIGLYDGKGDEIYEGDVLMIPNYEWWKGNHRRKSDVLFTFEHKFLSFKIKVLAPDYFSGVMVPEILFDRIGSYAHLGYAHKIINTGKNIVQSC